MVKTIAVLQDRRISGLSIALLLPFLVDDQVPQRRGSGLLLRKQSLIEPGKHSYLSILIGLIAHEGTVIAPDSTRPLAPDDSNARESPEFRPRFPGV
jgi:hypothetical protein